VFSKSYRYLGVRTSNEAAYEALLMALQRAIAQDFSEIVVRSSSELMINQLIGSYSVKHASLRRLHRDALTLLWPFDR
jgi:ribonuclease HI